MRSPIERRAAIELEIGDRFTLIQLCHPETQRDEIRKQLAEIARLYAELDTLK